MDASLLPSINSEAAPTGAVLEAHEVSHSVNIRRGYCKHSKKVILDRVSVRFEAGSLTAILGPSGAGKSTLLSVLRTGRCNTAGSLTLDGFPYSHSRGRVVTVPQDDVLLPGLTPLEMLSFAAELRLRGSDKATRKQCVLSVLRRLQLADDEIAQRIGSVEERGLSGGQRKRVSIGVELIGSPRALLVDEPTSGLDAKTALDVVRLLKSLCRDGIGPTVIASIHQPSWRVFREFGEAVLLARGAVAYSGRTDAVMGHFEGLGFVCPPNENPADYFLVLLQDELEARGCDFVQSWRVAEDERAVPAAAAAAAADASPPSKRPRQRAEGVSSYRVGICKQVWVLLRRRLYDQVQDPSKFGRQLLLKIMVGLLVGIIWLNEGRSQSFTSIFPTIGSLFLIVNNSSLDVLLDTVLHFPLSRALLKREYNNGMFSVFAFWLSTTLSNLMLCTLNALLLALPVFFLVGFTLTWTTFGIFVATLTLMSLIGGALGVVTGCIAKDIGAARTAVLPTLVPLLIFSGYLIPLKSIPWYFKWCYYASFFQYSFGVLQINELLGRNFTQDCPVEQVEKAVEDAIHQRFPSVPLPPLGNFTCQGETYLQQQGLYPVPYGGLSGYFAILSGYMVVAQLGAYATLSWKVGVMASEH